MTRRIILDTETTGLEFKLGDRVIEIGCVELVGRKLSERRFHCYLNPECPIEVGAQAVHGLTNEFLADKPKFADIAQDFLEFVRGAELVIHNAAFDIGFLNYELERMGVEPITTICSGVIDTLAMARELHPGRKNSLDALCERYFIDNSNRTLHGALLDAELLADVYLAMTRGQESLIMELDVAPAVAGIVAVAGERRGIRVLRASAEELVEHDAVLAQIERESKGKCLWLKVPAIPAPETSLEIFAARHMVADMGTAQESLAGMVGDSGIEPLTSTV